jgi:hypothetical protein
MAANELRLRRKFRLLRDVIFQRLLTPPAAAQKRCVKVISPTTTLEHGEYREQ